MVILRSPSAAWALIGWSVGLAVLMPRVFARNFIIILLCCVWLATLVGAAVLLGHRVDPGALALEFGAIAAYMVAAIIVFASFGTLELMAALISLGLPTRPALAVGIGIRMIPALFANIGEVLLELRARRVGFSIRRIRRFGVGGVVERLIVPLLVEAIRIMEVTTLSVTVHELEYRISAYRLPPIRWVDYFILLTCVASAVIIGFY
jgi:hypothetical protein